MAAEDNFIKTCCTVPRRICKFPIGGQDCFIPRQLLSIGKINHLHSESKTQLNCVSLKITYVSAECKPGSDIKFTPTVDIKLSNVTWILSRWYSCRSALIFAILYSGAINLYHFPVFYPLERLIFFKLHTDLNFNIIMNGT